MTTITESTIAKLEQLYLAAEALRFALEAALVGTRMPGYDAGVNDPAIRPFIVDAQVDAAGATWRIQAARDCARAEYHRYHCSDDVCTCCCEE